MPSPSFFRKYREPLVILGVVLLSLFVARGAYNSQMVKVAWVERQLDTEEKKSQALDRIVTLNEKLETVRKRSWPTTDFASVVEALSGLADGTQLRIEGISPAEKKDEKYYISIPFFLTGFGTYREMARFLAAVSSAPNLLLVREVTLTPDQMAEWSSQGKSLRVDIKGQALYLKK